MRFAGTLFREQCVKSTNAVVAGDVGAVLALHNALEEKSFGTLSRSMVLWSDIFPDVPFSEKYRLASDVAFRFPDIARANSTAPRLMSHAVQRCVHGGVSLAQARAAKTAASALAASALEGACTEAHRTPLGDSAAAVCS